VIDLIGKTLGRYWITDKGWAGRRGDVYHAQGLMFWDE
jgi:hypothetical protein